MRWLPASFVWGLGDPRLRRACAGSCAEIGEGCPLQRITLLCFPAAQMDAFAATSPRPKYTPTQYGPTLQPHSSQLPHLLGIKSVRPPSRESCLQGTCLGMLSSAAQRPVQGPTSGPSGHPPPIQPLVLRAYLRLQGSKTYATGQVR